MIEAALLISLLAFVFFVYRWYKSVALLTTAESAATVTRERRPVIHRVPSIANLLLSYPSAEYWLVRKAFHWVRESLDTTYHAIIGLQ
ncbi:MAG: hypothetical protein ACE5OR_16390, partial [bacterium]